MLTAKRIREAGPGVIGDGRGGRGLALRIHRQKNGRLTRRWRQRVRVNGQLLTVGIGPWPEISLTEARKIAVQNAALALRGIDPRHHASNVPTFDEAAERVIALHRKSWKDPAGYAVSWRQTFRVYCSPRIGSKRVDQITPGDVVRLLEPHWLSKPSAARIALQRVGAVARWAVARGLAEADFADRNVVSAALPKQPRRGQYAAVPHAKVADVLRAVQETGADPATRAALVFCVLTAARISEVVNMEWREVDLDAAVWTVPSTRAKTKRAHRVPLSPQALGLLRGQRKRSRWVFANRTTGKPVHRLSPQRVLRSLKVEGSVHGFRSSFRDWAAETGVDRQVAEACLAHTVGGVEGAYLRTDRLDQRRPVMDDWGRHVTT